MSVYKNDNELYHHGIQGQKWGVRRFQNEDGTLTAEGKARYYGDYKRTESQKYDIRDVNKLRRGINAQQKVFMKNAKKQNLRLGQYDPEYYEKMGKMLRDYQKKYGNVALKQVKTQQTVINVGKKVGEVLVGGVIGNNVLVGTFNTGVSTGFNIGFGTGINVGVLQGYNAGIGAKI